MRLTEPELAALSDASGCALFRWRAGWGNALHSSIVIRTLARRKLPPRDWEPILYLAYSVLLARPGARATGGVAVARLLLESGADPNARYLSEAGKPDAFPALYASIDPLGGNAEIILTHGAISVTPAISGVTSVHDDFVSITIDSLWARSTGTRMQVATMGSSGSWKIFRVSSMTLFSSSL